MAILDQTFLEAYPIHVRQKHFFDARQKEGQSAIEFREELLSLLEEADGVNITCNDLICMMLQIGLSDQNLQRELGAIHNPTLDTFSEKIEGFEEARRTMSGNAYEIKTNIYQFLEMYSKHTTNILQCVRGIVAFIFKLYTLFTHSLAA